MALRIPIPAMGDAERILAERFTRLQATLPDPYGPPPALIVSMPTTWANKYQILLYSAATEYRCAVVGARTPADLGRIFWPGPVILHAHWFAPCFTSARSLAEARKRWKEAKEDILAFRDRTGARLLWTAHNVVPHGNAFPDLFLELRRWVFGHFDAVHVMDKAHVPQLEQAFGVPAPETVFEAPHMSYAGTVLNSVSPMAARAHFGIPHDAFVFGFFGSIQSYKNTGALLHAFDRIRATADRPVALIIGGVPSDIAEARRIDAAGANDPDIHLLLRKVEDHEIQYIHNASDLMVLPYEETLNSGAAMMAATFRRPFLFARSQKNVLPELGGIGFDNGTPEALERAMRASMTDLPDPATEQALATFSPARVSGSFFEHLRRHLLG